MGYPFWKDQEVSSARSNADSYRRETDKIKEQLEAINNEISKYNTLKSENVSKEDLIEILNKISEILIKKN